MSGKLRPSLLKGIIRDMDLMDNVYNPPLGQAKRDAIRELVIERLKQVNKKENESNECR